jgi:hypothetical protein
MCISIHSSAYFQPQYCVFPTTVLCISNYRNVYSRIIQSDPRRLDGKIGRY